MTGGRAKVRSRKTAFWKDTDKDRGSQLGRRISRESEREKKDHINKRVETVRWQMLHQNSQQANHQKDWHRAYGTYKTVKQTNRNYMTDRNTKLERKPDRWRDKTITRQTEGQPNRQLYAFFIVWGFCLIIKLRNLVPATE